MVKFRVFISSVQKEFSKERKIIYQYLKEDMLLKEFFIPIAFEFLPAASKSPDGVYTEEIINSNIFFVFIGDDYGFEDKDGISPTEREYDLASKYSLTKFGFVKNFSSDKRHLKESLFLKKISSEIKWQEFFDYENLKTEIYKVCITFLRNKGLISYHDFDSAILNDCTLDEIDESKIEKFINIARSKRGFPLSIGTSKEDVLIHLNLLRNGELTKGSILSFGKNPQKFFPTAVVKCARFHGFEVAKPIPDYKVFGGDVFEQVDQAVDFVLSKLASSVGTRDKSTQVDVSYEIPKEVVSEAIVNAVAHRDYSSYGSVQIMIFSDRLEITNPGTLVPELSISKLKTQHASYPTNPLIAEPMYQAGYIERFGTGTGEIIKVSKKAELKEPEFYVNDGFKVVLWRPVNGSTQQVPPEYPTSTHRVTPKHPQSTQQVPPEHPISTPKVTPKHPQSNDKVPPEYPISTPRVKDKVVKHFTQINKLIGVLFGEMKIGEIQELLSLKDSKNFRNNYLKPALENGYIEMTDPLKPNNPNQKYRLTQKGKELKIELKQKINNI